VDEQNRAAGYGKPASRFLSSSAKTQDSVDDRLNVGVHLNEQARVVILTVFDLAIPTWIVHDACNNVVDSRGAQRRTVTLAATAAEQLERGLMRGCNQGEGSSSVFSLAARSCLRA
jgi:hypothetical protein